MLNLVLFGPPGAGKGTQSTKLIEKYELIHLSTGDIFRANIKGETSLGILAKSYIDKGELVPDEVVKHETPKGFIFDGFPRTVAQAEALDIFLKEKKTPISGMVALEVSEDELVTRLLERGKTSGRADDSSESTIRNRIAVYEKETSPVAGFYEKQNKFVSINGIGSMDEIFSSLCAEIDKL
jgi:adenylate kinase